MKHITFFLLGMVCYFASIAQQKTYFDQKGNKATDSTSAYVYRTFSKDSLNPTYFKYAEYYLKGDVLRVSAFVKTPHVVSSVVGQKLAYYPNGKLYTREQYNQWHQLTDTAYQYYQNGAIESIKVYNPEKKNADKIEYILLQDSLGKKLVVNGNGFLRLVYSDNYYESGPIVNNKKDGQWTGKYMKDTFVEIWENEELVSGTLKDSSGVSSTYNKDNYYLEPEYPGGLNTLRRNLGNNYRYPSKAMAEGISGTVIVGFIIERDGTMSNFKVEQDLGHGTGQEAIRALRQTSQKWKPGIQRGKPVRVAYRIPLTLNLQ
ncbi:energy transducer TonB [Sphingobacterium psychroaquaticum]|uniref:TonB family C-terminal domain-containing protein n=1 Tax=Sphingobacterium psychroaquaticum TaxID=561061 RepID=A0A1X7J4R0_9SPHI|nr:energy transducer TonB [Sphingobacterium psychroaquaticum]SMG21855.1 TonB family C-terminal domain-containing protein [Sphingobacterium psychroaquaticum]